MVLELKDRDHFNNNGHAMMEFRILKSEDRENSKNLALDLRRGYVPLQWDPKRLKKWIDRHLMKFNRGKCKALHPGRKNLTA